MKSKKTYLFTAVAASSLLLMGCMGSGSKDVENADGDIIVRLGKQTASNPKLPEGDTYEDNAYFRLAEEELGIELVNEFEAEGEDYDRQVALAISSGELPDIMQVSEQELEDLYESDLVADLSEVFEEYASDDLKEKFNSYEVNPLDDTSFDGGLYGIPSVVNVTPPPMVWVREDWLDDLEIDFDENGFMTLDELEELAVTFIEEDPADTGNPVGIGLVDWLNEGNYGGTWTMAPIASTFDAHPKTWIEDENGDVINGSLTPEMKDSLEFLSGWYDQGILDPQFGTRSWDDIMALAVNGQLGIVTSAWHSPDWGLSNVKEMHPEARFKPFAIVDDNNEINIANMDPKGAIAVVRKDFEHPEILINMLNLFYDDLVNEQDLEEKYPEIYEYQVLDVDASTRPLNMEIMSATAELDLYSEIKDAVEGNIPYEDISDVRSQVLAKSISNYAENPDDATTAEWALYHSRMKGLELGQHVLDNDKINWTNPVFYGTTPAIEQYGGNLDSLEDEEFIKIITGEESIDYFDKFVEMWHSQGGTEILSEITEAIDR